MFKVITRAAHSAANATAGDARLPPIRHSRTAEFWQFKGIETSKRTMSRATGN
jgi:hypothetical protein